MRHLLCLLVVSCALAREDEGRAKKPPFVVDAVGNTLPPPSNLPATVGSPVNLISPDRYEFYTFDESGELVKRLMTLAEIQAIVAAGEEADGLVTFANDNQPTVAFNFSQPSHNKVHSVVTNVQNVLKAQMEAHKNNPIIQPTLDTPDVSDTWSLILPSIFGNTGLDIVPDKTPNAVTPPETDTLEFHDSNLDINDLSFSKEGNNEILSSSTTTEKNENLKHVSTTVNSPIEEIKATPTTTEKSTTTTTTTTTAPPKTTMKTTTTIVTTTTTTPPSTTSITLPTTTKPTKRLTTTTIKPSTTKATVKLTTTKEHQTKLTPLTLKEKIKLTSTTDPSTKPFGFTEALSTTKITPTTTTTTLTSKTRSTTNRPHVSSTIKLRVSTTAKPATTTKTVVKFTPKVTTFKPSTTKKLFITTTTTPKVEFDINNIEFSGNLMSTENNTVQNDKNITFVPISAATYITERTTQKQHTARPTIAIINITKKTISTTTAQPSTTSEKSLPTITTYKPTTTESVYVSSTAHNQDTDKLNTTTITTQSVSPSTTVSSTEFLSLDNANYHQPEVKPVRESLGNYNKETDMPLFDVEQSISQIASDLGSNYIPLPTVSDIDDSTRLNEMDLESKENYEIDILTETDSNLPKPNVSENNIDKFVKISTIDPHAKNENKTTTERDIISDNSSSKQSFTTDKNIYTSSTLESTTIDRIMSESMGDLLSQVVNQAPQSILEAEDKFVFENNVTTEKSLDSTTTDDNMSDIISTTYETLQMETEKYQTGNDIPNIGNRNSELTTSVLIETTEESIIEKDKVLEDKVNSTLNKKSNEEDKKYVQITSLVAVNSTSSELKPEKLVIANETNQIQIVKINGSTLVESTKKGEIDISLVTNDTQNDITSTSNNTFNIKEIKNKTSSVDSENKNNYLVSMVLPKIDDFKKKIQKVNIDEKELANERNNSWKLISTVSPPKSNEILKNKEKNNGNTPGDNNSNKDIILDFSKENQGLEVTTKNLEEDIAKFTELCNELAFRYWNTMIENIDKRRSFVLSPYSITSMLAMMFMGARGATSGEMNDILKLDDMVTFNPHFTLKNISDSIETTPESGVIVSAFIRELYSDRTKGKILTFYKERAQQFYNGHVEEINFKLISDIIRRRTNLLVKRYTWGKISEYMKANTITMQPPLAAFSANIFQTDCSGSSVEGRDGEMYFVVSPTVRQRRLVPVPAVVYRSGFLAGYDPVLDATAAALGKTSSLISTLFVMPGQQGNVVHGEDLEALEQRLLDANPTTPSWNRLLRTLLPRIGLELQIPRFSHKSIFNVSDTLRDMGLKDLFDSEHADLGGLNGPAKDLYLSDMIQSTSFVTCGEDVIGEQHHVEEYPDTLGSVARRRSTRWTADWSEPRDYQRAFHDPHDVGEAMHLPLHLRPRQARLPSRNAQPTRLKFDRPFLYFVRHNPSGMILYVGRYNPRLLP